MQSGSPPSPVPEQGSFVWWEVIAGMRNHKDQASGSGLLLASEGAQRPISEDGAAGLVRLVSRRRLARCAGSIGTSNVACRGLTPDPATAIQAVTGSGVDDVQVERIAQPRKTSRWTDSEAHASARKSPRSAAGLRRRAHCVRTRSARTGAMWTTRRLATIALGSSYL